MEGDPHRTGQDVRLSGGQISSNYYRCSQSRKMSIGIAAESTGYRAERDKIPDHQHGGSSARTKNGNKTYQTRSTKRNMYTPTEGQSSAAESPMKRASVPDLSRNGKGVYRTHTTVVAKEPVATIKTTPRDGKLEKPNTMSHGKGNQKYIPPKRGQRFSHMAGRTTALQGQDTNNSDNPQEIKIKETLRMKLHKILGPKTATDTPIDKSCADNIEANVPDKPEASSIANKRSDESQEVKEKRSGVNLKAALEGNQSSNLRQYSDTIESDSEGSRQAVKRKRPMAKARPKSLRKKLSYENDENRAYFSKEKNFGAYFTAAAGRRSMFIGNENETESHIIRMTKLLVPLNDRSNFPESLVSESKKPVQDEEISLCGGMASAHKRPYQVQPDRVQYKNPCSIPEPKGYDNLGRLRSPVTPKFKSKENCTQELPRTNGDLFNDLNSPELVMNTKSQVPSPIPFDEVNEITRQSFKCMLAAKKLCFDNLFQFDSALEKSQFISILNNFQDSTTESGNSVASASSHRMRKRESEAEPLMSRVGHSRSTEEDLSANRAVSLDWKPPGNSPGLGITGVTLRNRARNVTIGTEERDIPEDIENTPDILHDEEQIPHGRKRVCVGEYVEDGLSCRSLSSQKGTRSVEPLEHDEEDDLDRGIVTFGYALERIKDKLVSSTKKKCSEILTSTAEEMSSKLHSAKSQVEKDVGKLTNLSRSRKQFLETRFNEQQEQLRLIHDKFRKEISRHLEDYSRTVECLHAESSELKCVIERQKAFHEKLLVQVEKTFENHLSDAQRRMAAVHEAGRLKMLQLKTAIGQCFKDGVFV